MCDKCDDKGYTEHVKITRSPCACRIFNYEYIHEPHEADWIYGEDLDSAGWWCRTCWGDKMPASISLSKPGLQRHKYIIRRK